MRKTHGETGCVNAPKISVDCTFAILCNNWCLNCRCLVPSTLAWRLWHSLSSQQYLYKWGRAFYKCWQRQGELWARDKKNKNFSLNPPPPVLTSLVLYSLFFYLSLWLIFTFIIEPVFSFLLDKLKLKEIENVMQEIASSEPGIEIDEVATISNEISTRIRDDFETDS